VDRELQSKFWNWRAALSALIHAWAAAAFGSGVGLGGTVEMDPNLLLQGLDGGGDPIPPSGQISVGTAPSSPYTPSHRPP
jgi:hypothetical protein